MQRVKNIRPSLTLLLTQGVNGLVMVRVRRESERFHLETEAAHKPRALVQRL